MNWSKKKYTWQQSLQQILNSKKKGNNLIFQLQGNGLIIHGIPAPQNIMQSLNWQLWRLWGNVEKNSPLRGLCPRLSTAPLHSTPPAGPVWGGSCNLTWFPSFHWETTGCNSCQLSHLCSRPSGRGAQPPAAWALIPRALKVPSSH